MILDPCRAVSRTQIRLFRRKVVIFAFVPLLAGIALVSAARAQMVTGADMPGFADAFGLSSNHPVLDYSVQEIVVHAGSSDMVNVLWPKESARVTLHFTNKTTSEIKASGVIDVIRYRTSVPTGDVWTPHVFRDGDDSSVPVSVDLPPSGSQDITVTPPIGDKFGGYALITDLKGHGRAFVAAMARVTAPDQGRVQFPTYALDSTWDEFMNEGVFTLFEKLGVKGMRLGGPYEPQTSPHFQEDMERLDRYMQWAYRHNVTVMLTLGDGDDWQDQPLGKPRPWLTDDNKMLDTKDDRAWLPSYDNDFQNWVQTISSKYGWPKGNLNAVELWNEPWEGISISGWGADIPRYREIFTHMAEGVEAARAQAGVKVLIGGTCSSSNARDKLFSDGSDYFLKWLDFISVHYQAMAADPSEVPEWIHRKSPYGPVRVWDTESWIANSDDRIAGVIASMRAQGQTRTAGVFDGNVYDSRNLNVDGVTHSIVQAWSPAAAVAATQKFIGQRPFDRLLFQNGLPWVFIFDGLPSEKNQTADAEDGTLVVLGDLSKIYDPARTLFRSISVSSDAHLVISNASGDIRLFDFYGNPVPPQNGKFSVPLNGLGYFLRASGTPGSFHRLIEAVQTATIDGYAPVEIVAHDLTRPVEQHPVLRLKLTNVLNHPITGVLTVSLGTLNLQLTKAPLTLDGNETRTIAVPITSGSPSANNVYPLSVTFDAGHDGEARHYEEMHVNFLARRTIHVDGDLSDWRGILPQEMPAEDVDASLTEKAWLPFHSFDQHETNGRATVFLAYDKDNFYFAAQIPDNTPDPGMLRFANRDDDSYFYPDTVTDREGHTLTWPAGVRHYSYRKNFDIPSGTGEHDNVQIAFNVLDRKPWLSHPPGVMPHFITYWDTDYEYALNPVAPKYGGGTEIWRLQVPGMPRKHFFPRQPKSPIDGGPVTKGKLVIRRESGMRIVEAAIPWTEMPDVYRKVAAGETIKFTCRINDNKGPAHEMAAGRSVSKYNSETFHDDWQTHWSNELEFGVAK